MAAPTMSRSSTDHDSGLREHRLAQVYRRDPEAEGVFWYSVVTTGIYCRSTCPARKARPENIRFHNTLGDARVTGFRPCRRCNPETASQRILNQIRVGAACELMESDVSLSTVQIAGAIGLSTAHFRRIFRQVTGTTPAAFVRSGASLRVSDNQAAQ
jgi:AraC family transcriptional regulator of adaptative response/methylated-DNA-[protein]-cysteine methyltransferase